MMILHSVLRCTSICRIAWNWGESKTKMRSFRWDSLLTTVRAKASGWLSIADGAAGGTPVSSLTQVVSTVSRFMVMYPRPSAGSFCSLEKQKH